VLTSAAFIGWTLLFLNKSYTTTAAEEYGLPVPVESIRADRETGPDGKSYRVAYLSESGEAIPQGKYLVDDQGSVAFVVDPGIGGRVPYAPEKVEGAAPSGAEKKGTLLGPDRRRYDVIEVGKGAEAPAGRYLVDEGKLAYHLKEVKKLDAPKASLFALIIDGILTRKLPWSLVLIGVMIAIMMELCGVSSLPFAVGVYLPVSTSVPIFVGGLVRWLVDRKRRSAAGDEEFSPGTLLSSGYIAGGAIAGLVAALVAGLGMEGRFDLSKPLGAIAASNLSGIAVFAVIAGVLYYVGVRGKSAVGSSSSEGSR
jgi:hypothetical protein